MTEQEAMREAVRKWNHTESPDFECEFTESELIGAYFWKSALQWAAEGQEPVAWIRFCSDGTYEGPIADCDKRMDDVRRTSGAWTPLYAATVMNMAANRVKLLEEDIECFHLSIDDHDVPRTDENGRTYSMYGRALLLVEQTKTPIPNIPTKVERLRKALEQTTDALASRLGTNADEWSIVQEARAALAKGD